MKKLFALLLAALLAAGTLTLPALAADAATAQGSAEMLYNLGLFQGVGTKADGSPDFALDRATTRAEAVTMLVRLLGAEDQALRAVQALPFSDVPNWARPYVSYAYRQGYTKGVTDTQFGSYTYVTAAQYLTFILRALGYEDGKDFNWRTPFTLTDQLGITAGEYGASTASFLRGDAAAVSAAALTAARKGSDSNLLEHMVSAGIIPDRNLVVWGCTALDQKNGYISFLFYPVKGSPSTFSSFKVNKVTVNGVSCQTLQVTTNRDVAAYLASIGVSTGGFGYIEVTFDQNAAKAAAKETFTQNGTRQPWLVFQFSCTGVRADGKTVNEIFTLRQAPV